MTRAAVVLRFLGVAFVLLGLVAQPATAAEPDAELGRFLRHPALRGAKVGVAVIDLDTGERLVDVNADRALVPASNQKLLITAASLAHWGPAYRFETPVMIDGALGADGVVAGPLWVVGRGDPSLVSETLWKLAEEIRLRGVRTIRGGLRVDTSYFDGQHVHPDWQPVSARAYHAPTGAFAANYSSFRIQVSPGGSSGQPATVDVAPFVPYFRVRSEALTIARAGRLSLDIGRLADGSGERVAVRGAVAIGAEPRTYWRAVALPELYAAEILRVQLEAQGVRVEGPIRIERAPATARELLRFKGEPLGVIVRHLNKFSNNFIAEQLTKRLGAETSDGAGSWASGTRAIRSYMDSIGALDGRTVIADGSGLSPRNRVSASTLAQLIRHASREFVWGPEFLASLPLGGQDGTLEERLENAGIELRGKTGHLRHVSSLAGVVPGPTGRRVFTILVNGAQGSSAAVDDAIDAFVAGLGTKTNRVRPPDQPSEPESAPREPNPDQERGEDEEEGLDGA
jgi:D-alanyl-D-alanine carboxypeptidase/D-alanyl-D-alanine-endopeptidase (penicillin-binding protein 4)